MKVDLQMINGKMLKIPIKMWLNVEDIEEEALQQAINLSDLFCAFKHVALMPDCLSEDTEILTDKGFKLIKNLSYTDNIANYKASTEKVFFAKPKKIIHRKLRKKEKVYEFSSSLFDKSIVVTENHRMPYFSNMEIRAKEINKLTTISHYKWGGKGLHNEKSSGLNYNLLCLIAWAVGDGNIKKSNKRKDGTYSSKNLRFELTKERKIKRICHLLDSLDFIYNIRETKRQTTILLNIESSRKVFQYIGENKQYPIEFLSTLSNEEAKLFLEEALKVDGNWTNYLNYNSMIYNSKRQEDIDFLSALIAIHFGIANDNTRYSEGFNKKIKMHYLSAISNEKLEWNNSGLHNSEILKKEIKYKGKVVCVSCDTGYFIARQNGITFITGNCHVGYGMPIGGVIATKDYVIPNAVGVDIGCFTGDTKIRLIDGSAKSLKRLYKSKINPIVFCCNKKGKIKVKKAKVLQTRIVDELLKIELDNGEVIKCTTDHKFLMRDLTYKKANKLNIRDSLAPLYLFEEGGYLICKNNLNKWSVNKKNVWSPVHKLVANEFNLYNTSIKNPCIHHIDENKKNNYPKNLKCLEINDHLSNHAKEREWFKSDEFKEKRINKLKKDGFYHPSLYEKKKKVALKNMNKLLSSKGFKEAIKNAGIRGKKYLKNDDPNFIQIQNESKISKLLKVCIDKYEEITEENYEKARKEFRNYPKYKTALKRIRNNGYTDLNEFALKRNHKIISIKTIKKKQKVYCLYVPKYHNFALASGVFVHNCGVLCLKTSLHISEINQNLLKKVLGGSKENKGGIRSKIPVGFNHHSKKQDEKWMPHKEIPEICAQEYQKALKQIGTLGGGNHFIEIQKGDDDFVYVMIHSGSRNIGYTVANHYIKLAKELNTLWGTKVPSEYDLAVLPMNDSIGQKYLEEMHYCVDFAYHNRKLMIELIKEAFTDVFANIEFTDEINIAHNYAQLENHFGQNVLVHRKGATLAREDTIGLIPGSQGTSSFIVKGKGNIHSFYSCSHGAGRLMSRKKARENLDLESEKRILDEKGIIHSIRHKNDLDEASSAYKDINTVMQNQSDLVEIVRELIPLAVIKG